MAKLKGNNKNTTKTKTNFTSLKSAVGKVRKVRINDEGVKSKEYTPDISIKKLIGQDNSYIPSESQSLSLKYIGRNTTKNSRSKKSNSLREQCKTVEKNSGFNLENKQASTLTEQKEKVDCIGQCNTRTKGKTKITKNRKLKINSSNINANSVANGFDGCPKTKSIRNCCVKVKRLSIRSGLKEVGQNTEPLSSSLTRRCVVRLQKTPIKNVNNLDNPKNLTTSKCRVKIKRISSSKKNCKAINQNSTLNKLPNMLPEIENVNISEQRSNLNENMVNDGKQNSLKSIYKQNNTLPNLKHLRQLSLKKTNAQKDNNALANIDILQNSAVHFEPIRNSTMLEIGSDKNNIKNNQMKKQKDNNFKENTKSKNISLSQDQNNNSEITGENTTCKRRSGSRNLANKSNEIEDILNSLDDDINDQDNINGVQETLSPTKTKKFFHCRSKDLNEKCALVNKPKNLKSKAFIKKKEINKKQRFSTKRYSLMKRKDIYEFLSQSQTSDSDGGKHLDPAADIIRKLIDQNKVRVATNCKGKGRPIFKRKIPHRPKKKTKTQPVKKQAQFESCDIKNTAEALNEMDDQLVEDNHFEDHFDQDLGVDDSSPDANCDVEDMSKYIVKRFKNKNIKDQEGTFSRLARSVLVQETDRSNLKEKENSTRLLEKAKKYISTPKNKQQLPETALHTGISPILMSSPRSKGSASPWRIDEDEGLPRIFNFSRSSANLPSFSSDCIPSTPKKDKSKTCIRKQQQQSCHMSDQTSPSLLPLMENQNSPHETSNQSSIPIGLKNTKRKLYETTPAEKEPSSISSFSSNDSNAENMPPSYMVNEKHTENSDIFNLKQLPNPRRVLTNRSPLKTINILEVVHLPPYKIPFKTNSQLNNDDAVNIVGSKENKMEKSLQTNENIANVIESPQKIYDKKQNDYVEDDLFGFEEFLSQTNEFSQENNCINEHDVSVAEPHITIHDKLKDLRKLKPDDKELELSFVKEKSNYPLTLFEDESNSVGVDGLKQKNIKEMLCSTMMHQQPSTSKKALKELETRNLWVAKKPYLGEDLDLSELFNDPEPETTFDENEAHRTYVRPFKRKRRLKENQYIVFLESDESGDEEMFKDHQKQNHSNETETSSETIPKKKRQRKLPKETQEMKEFVEEFNKMCREVDSYELMVEKSA